MLVRDYISPFVLSAGQGEEGWRTCAAMMGRLANSPLGTEVIARRYDPTAREYFKEFHCALPDVPEADAIDGHPAALSWIGGVRGHSTISLVVEHFGHTGTLGDLHHYFGIVLSALARLSVGRPTSLAYQHFRNRRGKTGDRYGDQAARPRQRAY